MSPDRYFYGDENDLVPKELQPIAQEVFGMLEAFVKEGDGLFGFPDTFMGEYEALMDGPKLVGFFQRSYRLIDEPIQEIRFSAEGLFTEAETGGDLMEGYDLGLILIRVDLGRIIMGIEYSEMDEELERVNQSLWEFDNGVREDEIEHGTRDEEDLGDFEPAEPISGTKPFTPSGEFLGRLKSMLTLNSPRVLSRFDPEIRN